MEKYNTLKKLQKAGIVAVMRADSPEDARALATAIRKGGITILEVTMTIPYALDIIKDLCHSYVEDEAVLIGAGTVLDAETCKACIDAGAQFVVSPGFSLPVIKTANRYAIPVMSGAMTISEVIAGLEAGADIIKVFPGNLFGPAIIKSFKGPVPQANYVPTGGVSLENMSEWFAAGAFAVGIGSDLTKRKKNGGYEAVQQRAMEYVAAFTAMVKTAR